MVNKQIISKEQPELVKNCEIELVKQKSKINKDILISSFYVPPINEKELNTCSPKIPPQIKNDDLGSFRRIWNNS